MPELSVWVSSTDLDLGGNWTVELERALREAKAIITLCSAKSLERPWLNYESGFGAGKNVPVIPVCHAGLARDRVPKPLSDFLAVDLREADGWRRLVRRLAELCGVPEPQFDAEAMKQRLSPRVSARTGEIGLSWAHRQAKWPDKGERSLFSPESAGLDKRWNFRKLENEDQLVAAEMSELSGLIVGSPFRAAMSSRCITEIVEWVRDGGRLLLLGYELGDRHHNANLGELARRFGLHPMPDIVGPSVDAKGGRARKPYDEEIELDPDDADPHDLTHGLGKLCLVNLQTVMLDPGATAWLKIGSNAVYRIAQGGRVRYEDGIFGSPTGAEFEVITGAPWIPVAAQAPRGLCGQGAVHFIGTWDLLPPRADSADPRTVLVERLLDWLAGKT
jgi:hypothetical protein